MKDFKNFILENKNFLINSKLYKNLLIFDFCKNLTYTNEKQFLKKLFLFLKKNNIKITFYKKNKKYFISIKEYNFRIVFSKNGIFFFDVENKKYLNLKNFLKKFL